MQENRRDTGNWERETKSGDPRGSGDLEGGRGLAVGVGKLDREGWWEWESRRRGIMKLETQMERKTENEDLEGEED